MRIHALVTGFPLVLAAIGSCTSGGGARPAEPLALGPSLAASFTDPILLTIAAARPRAEYRVDEGYTLAVKDDVLVFTTDTAGDVGVVFRVEGVSFTKVSTHAEPPRIDHTTSDGVVVTLTLTDDVSVELRAVAVSSRALTLEAVTTSRSTVSVEATAFLYRCDGASDVTPSPRGFRTTHGVADDPLLAAVAPGTYALDFVDGLDAETSPTRFTTRAYCDLPLDEALAAALGAPGSQAGPASLAAITVAARVGPRPYAFRFFRGTVDVARADQLERTLEEALSASVPALLAEGALRLADGPIPASATRDRALLLHSSYALLEQVMMPAEGAVGHDYFVFGREPTWWFGRIGMHIHEGLALIATARYAPRTAVEVLRNYVERVEADGYVPYNFGPYVEQTLLRTASAPFFSYVAWEVFRLSGDRTFLRDAFEAGKLMHGFWERERDADADGLAEWGGASVTETLRDLDNVIWSQVAEPQTVEAVDLNAMLVMDARALAAMATELGEGADADAYTARAEARSARVEAVNWDDVENFYFHVDETSETFTSSTPRDLVRKDIGGLLPLWAGIPSAAHRDALLAELANPLTFGRPYGVPSLAVDDASYTPRSARCCMWNGPSWVPWNYLLARGLEDAGRVDLARDLTERTEAAVMAELRRSHQFREHYSADDPLLPNESMPNYLWSALVADAILRYGAP